MRVLILTIVLLPSIVSPHLCEFQITKEMQERAAEIFLYCKVPSVKECTWMRRDVFVDIPEQFSFSDRYNYLDEQKCSIVIRNVLDVDVGTWNSDETVSDTHSDTTVISGDKIYRNLCINPIINISTTSKETTTSLPTTSEETTTWLPTTSEVPTDTEKPISDQYFDELTIAVIVLSVVVVVQMIIIVCLYKNSKKNVSTFTKMTNAGSCAELNTTQTSQTPDTDADGYQIPTVPAPPHRFSKITFNSSENHVYESVQVKMH